MSAPSPDFVAFMSEAIRRQTNLAKARGEFFSPALREELGRFTAWLTVGPPEVTTGQEGSRSTGGSDPVHAGGVVMGAPPQEELAVGLDEAGRLLGVSRSTIKRHIRSGALASATVRRRRVVPRAAIDELLGRATQ